MNKILKIDSSGRHVGSISRQLTDNIVEKLKSNHPNAQVVERDVSEGLPFVNETMIGGYYIPNDQRNNEQLKALELSDQLVDEFASADALVFGIPIYNFSVPASLKAYIDLVCRMGLTFKYSESGPEPLLPSRKTYVVITSGGTQIDSDIDFTTNYFRHVLGFLGIKSEDIEIIKADAMMFDGEKKLDQANNQIVSIH